MTERTIKILVVDDEAAIREVLDVRLREWGFEVSAAADGAEALEIAERFRPDVTICDVVMPQISGLELLRALRKEHPYCSVIVITAQGSIDIAVEAMKHGARDFITKPLDYSKLRSILRSVEEDLESLRESRRLSSQLERGAGFGEFVGTSKVMREVYELISNISHTDASVLITGESGTGKELAARAIHALSARVNGPFVAINASAIPENLMESEIFGHERGAFTGAAGVRTGCFELANRGTLFLDEIAEMPLSLQPKLLRVLEDHRVRRLGGGQEFQVDVRVLAATNRDPRNAVESGSLREDLYYRLNVFTILLPPLRERRGDIGLLAQDFIRDFNNKHNTHVEAVRDEAMEMLRAYNWPGNVRELKNVMERAVILAHGEWIELTHLPPYVIGVRLQKGERMTLPTGTTAADVEKELILKTLKMTGNNKAEAARQLGFDVKTIRNKLKGYGIV